MLACVQKQDTNMNIDEFITSLLEFANNSLDLPDLLSDDENKDDDNGYGDENGTTGGCSTGTNENLYGCDEIDLAAFAFLIEMLNDNFKNI